MLLLLANGLKKAEELLEDEGVNTEELLEDEGVNAELLEEEGVNTEELLEDEGVNAELLEDEGVNTEELLEDEGVNAEELLEEELLDDDEVDVEVALEDEDDELSAAANVQSALRPHAARISAFAIWSAGRLFRPSMPCDVENRFVNVDPVASLDTTHTISVARNGRLASRSGVAVNTNDILSQPFAMDWSAFSYGIIASLL